MLKALKYLTNMKRLPILLLILVAAGWLGPPAASATSLVIAAAAVWATHVGVGVFAGDTVRENLQNLNLFLAAVSLTGLALGAFRTSGSLWLPGSVLVAGWALNTSPISSSKTSSPATSQANTGICSAANCGLRIAALPTARPIAALTAKKRTCVAEN